MQHNFTHITSNEFRKHCKTQSKFNKAKNHKLNIGKSVTFLYTRKNVVKWLWERYRQDKSKAHSGGNVLWHHSQDRSTGGSI